MTSSKRVPMECPLDSEQMSALKVWSALMPDYMKMLKEVRDAMIGRLDTPTPTPGLVDQVRALQEDVTHLQTDMVKMQVGLDKLNHGRIDRLEEHDIVRVMKENKKLTTVVILVLLTIIAPPEIRAIIANWLQDGWLLLFG